MEDDTDTKYGHKRKSKSEQSNQKSFWSQTIKRNKESKEKVIRNNKEDKTPVIEQPKKD